MSTLDQFASVFKSATKVVFHLADIQLENILVVTDLETAAANKWTKKIENFLPVIGTAKWSTLEKSDFKSIQDLMSKVEEIHPHLIITYRHLHSQAWRLPYSLGEHLDVLTQVVATPIMVLPHPLLENLPANIMYNTNHVMVITDHLSGADKLINYAVKLTADNGKLVLAHIEDKQTYDRYIQVISKIPQIDTEIAAKEIMQQLLKEPRDYIESCRKDLKDKGVKKEIGIIISSGNHLGDYQQLIQENEVDLLIMNTKDEDQLAMHGMAYPLAVELTTTPLLFI